MDRDWSLSPVTERLKDKAWSQLGTSGSGNHFVEFGLLMVPGADRLIAGIPLPQGEYLALLSHSGSRGTGAEVARHYSECARSLRPRLPGMLSHLAWLDLEDERGHEYWGAMTLMGHYAAANHELIHRHILSALGAEAVWSHENHHNFAWEERHDGRMVVVHRKGATPAAAGTIGIIPGTMADPGYIVRGKGSSDALDSAAHGAGRRMSRKEALRRFRWEDVRPVLRDREVRVLSAGLDEVPMAYKPIDEVMAAQSDLVEVLARFQPRLVKMAPSGEPPED